jgi:hypothetical protein
VNRISKLDSSAINPYTGAVKNQDWFMNGSKILSLMSFASRMASSAVQGSKD